ncbi:phosphotransferase [Asanoa sp. NPDC049573]|uniref:phosphotransferase n=1 Tax=Asanoa sp. NPDC049573 TaxID=3155396 RepID=UPI0034459573
MLGPPPFAYHATAVRPTWASLAPDLRAAVAARLGSPVVGATTAGAGFTGGFAAVLETAAGDKVFVKAARASDQRHLCDWYAHEARVVAALPSQVAAPRPRWTLATPDWFVLCLDAVDGGPPALPWSAADLSATLDAWATAADALVSPPAALVDLGLPALSTMIRDDLSEWGGIAAGHTPLPPGAEPARGHLAALAALEATAPALATTPGTALVHGDLRVDNVLIDTGGRAWLCDWNWLCHGPAWFDTAMLLITAYADGLDADSLWANHPTAAGAPGRALDAALTAMSGYFLTRATAPPNDASPLVRAHQRWHGDAALSWLLTRNGWA